MSAVIKLPIKYGLQANYDALIPDATVMYICRDTGNMYLGDKKLGNNLLFYESSQIPKDIGNIGDHCLTPSGIYIKTDDEDNPWSIFSDWEIKDNQLYINGNIPYATEDRAGMVVSSNDTGSISVDEHGKMTVNGWDDMEKSNYIYNCE